MRRGLMGACAVLVLALGGCGAGCADEVVQHEPSPYGEGTAIVFVRDCGGAATAPTAQVAIVGHVDAGTRDRTVVFVADDGPGAGSSGPGEGPRVRVRWIGANRLEIAHPPGARTSRREMEHGDVRITYAALP